MMKMLAGLNPFLIGQAVLSLWAAIYELNRGNIKLACVYTAWTLSNAVMSTIGGK